MKKFSLFLSAMLISMMSFAGVVTFDADVDKGNAGTDSNNAAAYTITKDGVTVEVSSGILGTYNNEMHYRIYKNQTLKITSTAGNITSVQFTCTAKGSEKYGPGCFTADSGEYTNDGAAVGTWTGSATEITFTASANQVRATQIVVTYVLPEEEPEPTPDPETGLTYNVTVPAGTNVCYIAGDMNTWTFTEMTKVDDTHYTITIAEATLEMGYKYCSGPDWAYVEKGAEGEELQNRVYSENDVVAAWAAVYDPNGGEVPVDPTPDPEDPKDITVKAKVPAEWTDQITAWVWPTGGNGSEVVPTQEGEWYVYTHNGTELNIIFKNGAGWTGNQNQTEDMTFTESTCIEITYNEGAKATYTVVDCEGGDTPVDPTPDPETGVTYNVTVPAGTNACYIAGDMNTWTFTEMTKVDDTHYTITIAEATTAMGYKYCSGPDWAYVEKSAEGEEIQNRVYSENDVVAEWAAVYDPNGGEVPVDPAKITYVLMGVGGDWTTGIALTANPNNENEYMLLNQSIAEGDAVKVATLTDGVATAWCGNVDEWSVDHTADKDGNIVLAPGKYDFYYKLAEDLIYIGASEEPEVTTDATFVFNTEEGLTALGIELPVTDAGNGAFKTDLDETAVYTSNGVGMSVAHKADGSENGKTRVWKKASGALDLRIYKDGGSLTFAAPEGNVITKVVFDGAKINFAVGEDAVADNTWEGNATSVTFAATATCNVNTVTVTYEAAAVEEPEVTTVELTYELTNDAVLDRMGRRYVAAEDENMGLVRIILPNFNAEITEYAEAFLELGSTTLAATATYAADAENNKEVYTATAISEDSATVYNVTMNVTLPTIQEYSFSNGEATAVPVTEDGYTTFLLEGEFIVGEELVPYELYVDTNFLSVMGTIGETFVLGEGEEQVAFYVEDDNTFFLMAVLNDEIGNIYNVEMLGEIEVEEVEIVITEEVDVTLYNLNLEVMGNMAMVTAGGEALSFWLTLLPSENYYGFYFSDSFSNIWYGDAQLQPYGDGQYTPDNLTVSFISTPDEAGNAIQYNFTLIPGDEPGDEPEYMVIEDEITNLVIDLESMAIIGGPSTMWQVDVFLVLAEDDNMDGQWSLSPESSVAIMGFDARIIDGYVYDIDINAPAAKAVLHVEDSGFLYEIRLNMTYTPAEAIVVVVEDATVQIDTIPLFGDAVDYALKMTAEWTYAEDGVTYPVLVEVPVYYPEATEPSEMTCTVTIGDKVDDDPWLGFGEGTLTITTDGDVVTAKGIVANPYTGVAFDVTVSGKLPQDPGPATGLDNVQGEVKALKTIKNGQLIIVRDGKEFNAQGAVVK